MFSTSILEEIRRLLRLTAKDAYCETVDYAGYNEHRNVLNGRHDGTANDEDHTADCEGVSSAEAVSRSYSRSRA